MMKSTPIPDFTVNEGEQFVFDPSKYFSDVMRPINFRCSPVQDWLSVESGCYVGIPAASNAGKVVLTVHANNGTETELTEKFSLTVVKKPAEKKVKHGSRNTNNQSND